LFLSFLYLTFTVFVVVVVVVLQTLTTVLIIHALMVDRVKIASTVIPVTAREDILGITVKQVNLFILPATTRFYA